MQERKWRARFRRLWITGDRSGTRELPRGDTYSNSLSLALATLPSRSAAPDVVYGSCCTLECPSSYEAHSGADSSFRRLASYSWQTERRVYRKVRDTPGKPPLNSLPPSTMPRCRRLPRAACQVQRPAEEWTSGRVRTRSTTESEREWSHT